MSITPRNIRNIFIYTFPKFAAYGLNLLILPFLTRLLAPEDFGIITFVFIFPPIIINIVTLGVMGSQNRYYFKYRTEATKLNAYYFSSQIFLFLMLFISSFIVFIFRESISKIMIGTPAYGTAFFIGYISIYFNQLSGFYLILYQYMEKAVFYSLFSILQASLISFISLLFVWIYKMSYMGVIYGNMAGNLIVFFIIFFIFNKKIKTMYNAKILTESIKYGIQLIPKSFTAFINRFFDKYMLNNMVSLSAVGVYNIGQNVSNSLSLFMSSIGASLTPVYYREIFDKGKEASKSTGRLFTVFSYISIAPVLILILFAQEIVYFIAPPSYYKATDMIIIMSGSMASYVFGKFVGVQYAYANKPYLLFPIILAETLANVVANIFLIPKFGLHGAAFSIMISAWVSNILVTYIGQKLYRIKYEWRIVMALQATIFLAIAAVLFMKSGFVNNTELFFSKLFFIMIFILIGIKAKILTLENLNKFPTIFNFSTP